MKVFSIIFLILESAALEPHAAKIFSPDEILEELIAICEELPKPPYSGVHGDKLVVGMVGYPNVGKSSTINVLFGSKRVGVSSTPGKTKHFQVCIKSCTNISL